ncbi:MAG: DNA polymerase I, partial [Clostridia bacterium]|nr:DNA polymerase I [Clostridia bacterium]
MIPHINEETGRIHTFFHQTVTATGRISSTDPNLQNIPTRTDLGKKLRKVFKAEKANSIFIDADYSQIELRVLAHMSNDEIMVKAFNEDSDIHTICASQIFGVPVEEVSKQLRSRAKAVNFGIVYGISDFGLSEQVGIKRKEAKQYIEQYLNTYHGIKEFMDRVVEEAKENGYVETLCNRRRYIPELKSNNYMVRKFGDRAAMNTPIQGTAADIMKIAMISVYKKLKQNKLKSKLVLQIHDELLIETYDEEKEEVINILKSSMENAMKLSVPLKVEVEEGKSWYQAK